MFLTLLALVASLLWVAILLLPWRPWFTREFLDGEPYDCDEDLSNITVLIPARNEEKVIRTTLKGVMAQGNHVKVILVDDQSEDKTAVVAEDVLGKNLKIISGRSLPDGWSGKLWALHQAFEEVDTPLVLLLDADIELKTGILSKLRREMMTQRCTPGFPDGLPSHGFSLGKAAHARLYLLFQAALPVSAFKFR
jgi:glycosyltransferase involved in cell wall biosynthesis